MISISQGYSEPLTPSHPFQRVHLKYLMQSQYEMSTPNHVERTCSMDAVNIANVIYWDPDDMSGGSKVMYYKVNSHTDSNKIHSNSLEL